MKKFLVFAMLAAAQLAAQDWPQWRGADNSFISPVQWTAEQFAKAGTAWKVNVGLGHSAVSVRNGRLYTLGEIVKADSTSIERISCLDAATGHEIWHHDHASLPGRYPGPGATPWVTDEVVVIQARNSCVYLFDAVKGTLIWKNDLVRAGLAEATPWGCCSSPVLLEDRVLINAGASGVALAKDDGHVIWHGLKAVSGHATPQIFKWQDALLGAFQSDTHFSVVDLKDGKVLASMEWDSDMDPTWLGGDFYLAGGHKRGIGSMRVRFDGSSLEQVWQSESVTHAFQPAMIIDNHAWAMFWGSRRTKNGQPLVCVDINNGDVLWTHDLGMWGAPAATREHLVVITGLGDLVLAAASAEEYRELARLKITAIDPEHLKIDGKPECFWTTPVLASGRIYCRSTYGDLYCITVKPS